MKAANQSSTAKEIIFYALGILLIAGFIFMYSTRFIPNSVMPPPVLDLFSAQKEWPILANASVFILFLWFLPYRGRIEWRSKGAVAAFILALFTEMFGIPLLLYILSPVLLYGLYIRIGNWGLVAVPLNPFYFGWPGAVLGAWMTLVGMLLVIVGWLQIHRATGLVMTGLYRFVRHPQYVGLFLIITGWVLHWPTLLTLLMYPILLVMYYRLSREEEKALAKAFGAEYEAYRNRTFMFLPLRRG